MKRKENPLLTRNIILIKTKKCGLIKLLSISQIESMMQTILRSADSPSWLIWKHMLMMEIYGNLLLIMKPNISSSLKLKRKMKQKSLIWKKLILNKLLKLDFWPLKEQKHGMTMNFQLMRPKDNLKVPNFVDQNQRDQSSIWPISLRGQFCSKDICSKPQMIALIEIQRTGMFWILMEPLCIL